MSERIRLGTSGHEGSAAKKKMKKVCGPWEGGIRVLPSVNASWDRARVCTLHYASPSLPPSLSLQPSLMGVRFTCACYLSAQTRDRLQAGTSRADITSTPPAVVVVGGCGGVCSLLSLSPSLALSLQERARLHVGIAALGKCCALARLRCASRTLSVLALRPQLRGCTRIRYGNQLLTRAHAEKQRQTHVCGAVLRSATNTLTHKCPSTAVLRRRRCSFAHCTLCLSAEMGGLPSCSPTRMSSFTSRARMRT